MHGGHLGKVGFSHVNVSALRLADVGSSTNSKVKHHFLRDFPDSLVEILDVLGYTFNGLNATVGS